ncbi:MAG TPA: HAD-IC family P-type ATPase, partial [Acidimicrobiales bacterium]
DAFADAVEQGVVFGRVTPLQKQAMVRAMQSRGHTVAMTGDGVNDVLALKDADCGVAMASGSEATRAVAQLVLLDSNFAAMPYVVAEGRRVINNIERVASLFLTKTVYSTILAIVTGLSGLTFPFRPRHLTLISALTIGIPAFFLALAPNSERVRKGFLRRVAGFAVPGGIYAFASVLVTYIIATADPAVDITERRTAAVMAAGGVGFIVLARIASPLNPLRITLIATMAGAFVVALIVPFVADFFELDLPDPFLIVVVGAFVGGAWPVLEVGARLVDQVRVAWERRHPDQVDPEPGL